MSENNYQPEILAVNKKDYDVVGMPPHNVGTFMWGRHVNDWTLLIYLGNKVRAYEITGTKVEDIDNEISVIVDFMKNGVL